MRILSMLFILLAPAAMAQSLTVSEEDPPTTCARGSVVSTFTCTGRFCDNITITCRPVAAPVANTFWTNWVESGGNTTASCIAGDGTGSAYMSGIACRGDFCDDISLHCTRFVGLGSVSCLPPTPHTDGQVGVAAAIGSGIGIVTCSGLHCDDKTISICPMVPR